MFTLILKMFLQTCLHSYQHKFTHMFKYMFTHLFLYMFTHIYKQVTTYICTYGLNISQIFTLKFTLIYKDFQVLFKVFQCGSKDFTVSRFFNVLSFYKIFKDF